MLSIVIRKSIVLHCWAVSIEFGHPIAISVSTMLHSLLTKANNGPLGQITYEFHPGRGDVLVLAKNQDAPSKDVEAFAQWIAFSLGLEAEVVKLPMTANLVAKIKFIHPEADAPSLIVRFPNTMSNHIYNFVATVLFDGLRLFSTIEPGKMKTWKIILCYGDQPFAGVINASRTALNLLLEYFTAETGIKIQYSEHRPSNEDFYDLMRAKLFPGL